jgi:hypothetical protein
LDTYWERESLKSLKDMTLTRNEDLERKVREFGNGIFMLLSLSLSLSSL